MIKEIVQKDNKVLHQNAKEILVSEITSPKIKKVLKEHDFDVICLFTPSGLKSLFQNKPDFKQNGTAIEQSCSSKRKTSTIGFNDGSGFQWTIL